MNVLEEGTESLRADLLGAASELVSYSRAARGTDAAVALRDVPAVVGRTVFSQVAASGATIRTETRDFILGADALGALEPRRGDVVTWHGRAFEVLSVGGEPCWRWSDPLHRARRVHTKLQAGAAL